MEAMYNIKLEMEDRYKTLIDDAVKFSTVYFVAAFGYCQTHRKLSKYVEDNLIELYCLLLLGLVAYHMILTLFVKFS